MMIKGAPCKITEVTISKTGKHGHAKAVFVGIDIFTGKKYETLAPTSHLVDVPKVSKGEYDVMAVEDGVVTLMDAEGETHEMEVDVDDPVIKDMARDVNDNKDVLATTIAAMGTTKIIGHSVIH